MIQEDCEKISNDRLLRFQTNTRQEWRPVPLGDNPMLERKSVTIGEIILANSSSVDQTLLGVVLRFRVKPSEAKKNEKFLFSSIKFEENKNIEFLLNPCYFLGADGSLVLNEGWNTFSTLR